MARDIDAVGILFALGAFLIALIAFGFQIFWYLQDGVWYPMSLVDVVKMWSLWLDPDQLPSGWLYQPESWLGLHKILSWIHFSVVAAVAGFFMLVMSMID